MMKLTSKFIVVDASCDVAAQEEEEGFHADLSVILIWAMTSLNDENADIVHSGQRGDPQMFPEIQKTHERTSFERRTNVSDEPFPSSSPNCPIRALPRCRIPRY